MPAYADEYPTRPTLPRWHELLEPKEEEPEKKVSDVTRILFAAAGIE